MKMKMYFGGMEMETQFTPLRGAARFFRRPFVAVLLMLTFNFVVTVAVRTLAYPFYTAVHCLDWDVCPGYDPDAVRIAYWYFQVAQMAIFIPGFVLNPLFAFVYSRKVLKAQNCRKLFHQLISGTVISLLIGLFVWLSGDWTFMLNVLCGFVLLIHLAFTIHYLDCLG
jgi:hypothetical protein